MIFADSCPFFLRRVSTHRTYVCIVAHTPPPDCTFWLVVVLLTLSHIHAYTRTQSFLPANIRYRHGGKYSNIYYLLTHSLNIDAHALHPSNTLILRHCHNLPQARNFDLIDTTTITSLTHIFSRALTHTPTRSSRSAVLHICCAQSYLNAGYPHIRCQDCVPSPTPSPLA